MTQIRDSYTYLAKIHTFSNYHYDHSNRIDMCYITLAMLSDVYAKLKITNVQRKILHEILSKKFLSLPNEPIQERKLILF